MNLFLMERFNDKIKSGKPIIYYNIEITSEEVEKRFLNAFCKNGKSMLDGQVLKLHDYKNRKLINSKYNPK